MAESFKTKSCYCFKSLVTNSFCINITSRNLDQYPGASSLPIFLHLGFNLVSVCVCFSFLFVCLLSVSLSSFI